MSQFNQSLFTRGMYLMYEGKFVARFKHCPRDRAGFISFLVKNFTVEEYFNLIQEGYAPAKILEAKGYISTTVKRILKDAGFPQTRDGFDAYIDARRIATRRA